jgi:hypothetical protein
MASDKRGQRTEDKSDCRHGPGLGYKKIAVPNSKAVPGAPTTNTSTERKLPNKISYRTAMKASGASSQGGIHRTEFMMSYG